MAGGWSGSAGTWPIRIRICGSLVPPVSPRMMARLASTSVMCDGTLRLSGVQYESTAKKATDERGDSLIRFAFADRGLTNRTISIQ